MVVILEVYFGSSKRLIIAHEGKKGENMLLKEFEDFIVETFKKEKLDIVSGKNEYGFTNIGREQISKIGYCIEVIRIQEEHIE